MEREMLRRRIMRVKLLVIMWTNQGTNPQREEEGIREMQMELFSALSAKMEEFPCPSLRCWSCWHIQMKPGNERKEEKSWGQNFFILLSFSISFSLLSRHKGAKRIFLPFRSFLLSGSFLPPSFSHCSLKAVPFSVQKREGKKNLVFHSFLFSSLKVERELVRRDLSPLLTSLGRKVSGLFPSSLLTRFFAHSFYNGVFSILTFQFVL